MFRKFVFAFLIAVLFTNSAYAQKVTSNFGSRVHPISGKIKHHAGMDIAMPAGSPVYATGDGYISFAGWSGGYGILIKVQHPFGYETRFGHLSRIAVMSGQYIRKGTLIGFVGSTGQSTGPHLHYEIRINGVAVDPRRYM
jgi:murein DD-endopeptidase MepM/ murein hydrolase activator NlpD